MCLHSPASPKYIRMRVQLYEPGQEILGSYENWGTGRKGNLMHPAQLSFFLWVKKHIRMPQNCLIMQSQEQRRCVLTLNNLSGQWIMHTDWLQWHEALCITLFLIMYMFLHIHRFADCSQKCKTSRVSCSLINGDYFFQYCHKAPLHLTSRTYFR